MPTYFEERLNDCEFQCYDCGSSLTYEYGNNSNIIHVYPCGCSIDDDLRNEIYDDGYGDGKNDGRAKGYNEGFEEAVETQVGNVRTLIMKSNQEDENL